MRVIYLWIYHLYVGVRTVSYTLVIIMSDDSDSRSSATNGFHSYGVAKHIEPGTPLYYLIILTRISFAGVFGSMLIWWVEGLPPNHWIIPIIFFHLITGLITFSLGLFLYIRQDNENVTGDVCRECNSPIIGERGTDWVLTCSGCGNEWVYAGNNTYSRVDSED